jgi:putative acetyltransferase
MNTFKRTDSDEKDFRYLVAQLDEYLRIMDGEDHAFYDQYNKLGMIRNVVVCYADDKPVGCGAFKEYENDTVEIKRMFVQPEYRGKGIAVHILRELESWAAELSYSSCVLETGRRQLEAIALYQKCGYTVIPNYGQYANVEYSVCMKKEIK